MAWVYLVLILPLSFAVCTQLLVCRPDEENISSYLQLIDKCLIHEVSGMALIAWPSSPGLTISFWDMIFSVASEGGTGVNGVGNW